MAAISPKKRNSIFDDSDDSDEEQEITKDAKPELPRKVNKTSKEENARSKKVEGKKETVKARIKSTREKGKEVTDKAQTTSTSGKGKKENDKEQTKHTQEEESNTEESPSKEENEVEEKKEEDMNLSASQMALIEKKRQQALLIRREKMNRKNPYIRAEEKKESVKVIRMQDTKLIDTGGGFFIEENETPANEITDDDIDAAMKLVTEPAPLFEEDRPFCLECDHPFNNSFLFHNFDHRVCDQCRDNDDKHALITKTDAKNEYLLKDVDLEKREPPLKFIVRKNPHNSRWGDMKLYLKSQIEKRALEVWGSEEAIEEAMEKKEEQREISKQRKYNKKMKELRMNVRSSLYTRATKTHEHEYGEEVYLPDEDEYSRTCKTCGHSYTYDKM
ncbi:putative DNA repair protein [Penaeus vannamei]|uniref:Putative DNA repair protein n=1 Tax=Penaeus vannamei TaxID=6689 RepID=A0A423SSL3_PENVA|nr:DNA repair protein complementing XP-A cells-like [Penaeus vannamei]XP_027225644.1 DNA repair protein complementing XP-A cells-like [Penaeus vannamei]XP_027225646.1 DNA repair protein complementing XP-A cells-like [Penaeus vannamei]ROT67242.1 putative DNA repair protein [Penaeus vannamei]